MKAKNKIDYYVTVVYPAELYFKYGHNDERSMDSKLAAKAKKFRGIDVGSGCGFGERDIQFMFKTEKMRDKFFSHLRRWKSINSVIKEDSIDFDD